MPVYACIKSSGATKLRHTMSSGTDTCSVEAGTLLAILQQYDKLRVIFDRWSVRRKADRDVLSIVLKPGGALGHEFLSAIIRAFPFRVVGPFLSNGSLDIEILDRALPHDSTEPPPQACLCTCLPLLFKIASFALFCVAKFIFMSLDPSSDSI